MRFAAGTSLETCQPLLPSSVRAGLIAGLLAATFLIPTVTWGGMDEGATIEADSGAKSWAARREKLTDQYVARLAQQAAMVAKEGEASEGMTRPQNVPGDAAGGEGSGHKNMSGLSAIEIQVRQPVLHAESHALGG